MELLCSVSNITTPVSNGVNSKRLSGKVEYWLIRTSWLLTVECEISMYSLDFTSISMDNLTYVFII